MTTVQILFKKPADGGAVGMNRTFAFAPTRTFELAGDPDAIVLPEPFEAATGPSGRLDVGLMPSGPGWVWRVASRGGGYRSTIEHVIVPAPALDAAGVEIPVEYTALVRVDPRTLDPVQEPDPAWWAELESARVLGAQIEAAHTETLQTATEAGIARDEAQAAADAATASGYSATVSPLYADALRIFYPAAISPRPNVVRIPIGETL